MGLLDAELEKRALARVGTTLNGKYHLDAVIGAGGMAIVYRATHRNQAEVAVKMLHPELSLRGSLRERFLREGRAANSVKHPGVVAVLDDDIAEDGSAFLVMELLDGMSVEALAERSGGRLPVPIACAILDQLLDILGAAHDKGIVHRDVKPANLFLTNAGALKLLDFGVARVRDALSGEASVTSTGVVLGTPAFMAPEQARAKSREIDARSDIWAAGATFFNIVSGRLVHTGENASQALIAAATALAPPVASVAPVPEPVAKVVDRALAFSRDARWGSTGEMQRALAAATLKAFGAPPSRSLLVPDALEAAVSQRGLPTVASDESVRTAQPVSATHSDVQPPKPRRGKLVTPAVVGAVGVAAVIVAVVSATRSAHPEPVAIPVPPPTTASVTPSESVAVPPVPSASSPEVVVVKQIKPHYTVKPCDPPYYVDDEGKHIFKKECLK